MGSREEGRGERERQRVMYRGEIGRKERKRERDNKVEWLDFICSREEGREKKIERG